MAHYNMKWGSPLLEDSLCTVRLHGSPGPLPSRPLVASFHSSAPPPSSVSSLSFPPPPPRVFIDLMAGLASPCRRLAPSQQRASSPSFLALLLGGAECGPARLLLPRFSALRLSFMGLFTCTWLAELCFFRRWVVTHLWSGEGILYLAI